MVAKLKTSRNDQDVARFLEDVANEHRRRDALTLLDLMADVTGEQPAMWGNSIVGFGSYHYTYASGREGDWFLTGLSPRKHALTAYIMAGFDDYDELLQRLGKFKIGKSCLYINKLEDVDAGVLRDLIERSVDWLRATYPPASS